MKNKNPGAPAPQVKHEPKPREITCAPSRFIVELGEPVGDSAVKIPLKRKYLATSGNPSTK